LHSNKIKVIKKKSSNQLITRITSYYFDAVTTFNAMTLPSSIRFTSFVASIHNQPTIHWLYKARDIREMLSMPYMHSKLEEDSICIYGILDALKTMKK